LDIEVELLIMILVTHHITQLILMP